MLQGFSGAAGNLSFIVVLFIVIVIADQVTSWLKQLRDVCLLLSETWRLLPARKPRNITLIQVGGVVLLSAKKLPAA